MEIDRYFVTTYPAPLFLSGNETFGLSGYDRIWKISFGVIYD
jgi:hypothetical protein